MKRTAVAAGFDHVSSIPRRASRTEAIIANDLPSSTGISRTIHDRASTFQAFFVPLEQSNEIAAFVKLFKQSSFCDKADHVMLAFRMTDHEIGLETGYDDDGERFSGSKLANLLQSMDVLGLVICVRQFGGIMLGPIRFQHITQCARDAIMRHIHERSVIENELRKLKIILAGRDKTILALRSIIQPKSAAVDTSPGMIGELSSQSSYVAEQKYKDQSITVLQRLLGARNRTIETLRAMIVAEETQAQSCATLST